MNILILTEGFFPGKKYGGPPVSVDNFCALMKDVAQCYVVATDHEFGETTRYADIADGWNDRGYCKVTYLSEAQYGYAAFEKIIQEISPDVIYLQSVFQRCVIPMLRLAKKYGIRVMHAPRGELCAGAFRKKYKKLPYIACLRLCGWLSGVRFQSTSEEETHAIHRYFGVPYDRIYSLTNIPSIPKTEPVLRTKQKGHASLVFLSRIHPKKNLLSAIQYLRDVQGTVNLDIYGPTEDQAYWRLCEKAVATLPSNVTVMYKGLVAHEDVHRVFGAYDAFLFPTLSENYGHVIAESLLAGCPVIISDQTPWTDINGTGAGWALPLNDPRQFAAAIQQVIDADTPNTAVKAYIDQKLDFAGLRKAYLAAFSFD